MYVCLRLIGLNIVYNLGLGIYPRVKHYTLPWARYTYLQESLLKLISADKYKLISPFMKSATVTGPFTGAHKTTNLLTDCVESGSIITFWPNAKSRALTVGPA